MIKAMGAAKNGQCSIKQAAENYKIPILQGEPFMEVNLAHHPFKQRKRI